MAYARGQHTVAVTVTACINAGIFLFHICVAPPPLPPPPAIHRTYIFAICHLMHTTAVTPPTHLRQEGLVLVLLLSLCPSSAVPPYWQ